MMISQIPFNEYFIKLLILFFIYTTIGCQPEEQDDQKLNIIKPEGHPFSGDAQQVVNEVKILNKEISDGAIPDHVESKIIKGDFKYPGANVQSFKTAEGEISWKTLQTDSAGWFDNNKLNDNYAYVSIESDRNKVMLMEAMGNRMVYVNGKPRIGNRYQVEDNPPSWGPQWGYGIIPVRLKKGKNHLLFQCSRGRLKITMRPMRSAIMFNKNDPTFPDLIKGKKAADMGGIVVMNGTKKPKRDLSILSQGNGLEQTKTTVPVIPPMTVRKVAFDIMGQKLKETGAKNIKLSLHQGDQLIDTATVTFNVKEYTQPHKQTFISKIDSSLQYYAVNPADGKNDDPKALFLSVHGASVEAINQAQSYHPKSWGHVVAPTNRRPYGYDWEDWGRIDALEVLGEAKSRYNIDEERVYLTGHSMGGHGTWYLGVTYPDKWAAIGPSAGWNSFWTYGGKKLMKNANAPEKLYYRSSSPSNTFGLVDNLKSNNGVYIIHGKDDQVVSVDQAYQMIDTLEKNDINYRFHEEPGAGHWWDNSEAPGAACVDWPPLFDFFARHRIPQNSEKQNITFVTANPGISAYKHWLGIEAQINHLKLSRAEIHLIEGKNIFKGETENVARLSFKLDHLSLHDSIGFALDGQPIQKIPYPENEDRMWLNRSEDGTWEVIQKPSKKLKGPHRYGTFKGAFRNNFMFVYATQGSQMENRNAYNKARYDAETFWYQGNGSVETIADTVFNASNYSGRDVILYGNADSNASWDNLLADSPVQVGSEMVAIQNREVQGDDLACIFVRPRNNQGSSTVGVVSATGEKGWKLLNSKQYMYPFYNAPDLTVFDASETDIDKSGIIVSGYFGLDWSLENGELQWNNIDNISQ